MTKQDVIIEKKKLLKQSWVVVKDSDAKLADRKAAAENIVELSNDLEELDKTFNVTDFKQTRYASLLEGKLPGSAEKINKDEDKPDVIWPTIKGSFGKKEEELLDKWTAVAYKIAKKQHPALNDQGDKFGTIVNAIRLQLIMLTK
ncbi:hypothetical protein [Nitrosopumilus sp.]|uniref:hypothetical protein n=1 Tax=Nitrosopumilus sp. TaxID=2024843 RepID=UPI003D09DF86